MAQLSPSHIDQTVGKRMQKRRKELGLTADKLSEQIGISHQQLLRYERGDNKINLAHLLLVAQALDTPLTWFFMECGVCPSADETGLKARYDWHWSRFDKTQKQAVIHFLDVMAAKNKP